MTAGVVVIHNIYCLSALQANHTWLDPRVLSIFGPDSDSS